MFKAPGHILLLGLLVCAVPACAQVESNAAGVTLVARVQETFGLAPVPLPAEWESSASLLSDPEGLLVGLNWRLRHGRTFQVAYELADEANGSPAVLSEGLISPSHVLDAIPVLSFLPNVPDGIQPVGAWGNRETDPSGVAGLLLRVPSHHQTQGSTLRLRAIIL